MPAFPWSLLLIYQPRRDKRLSWPGWLTYSGRFTHISGHPSATVLYKCHPSATGWAQDRKSLPAKEHHSTAVPCNQPADCRPTCHWRRSIRRSPVVTGMATSATDSDTNLNAGVRIIHTPQTVHKAWSCMCSLTLTLLAHNCSQLTMLWARQTRHRQTESSLNRQPAAECRQQLVVWLPQEPVGTHWQHFSCQHTGLAVQ